MFIPVGYSQANLLFTGDGLPRGAEVAIGLDNRGSDFDPAAIAAIVAAAWGDNLQEPTNTHVTLHGVLVKNGPNATGPFAELDVDLAGTNTTGDFNPAVSVLVRKTTALGGRHGRGRSYWPMAGEVDTQTGGLLSSAFVTGVTPSLSSFLSDLSTNGTPMVLLHGSAIPTPTAVTGLVVESRIAVQRRRNRR